MTLHVPRRECVGPRRARLSSMALSIALCASLLCAVSPVAAQPQPAPAVEAEHQAQPQPQPAPAVEAEQEAHPRSAAQPQPTLAVDSEPPPVDAQIAQSREERNIAGAIILTIGWVGGFAVAIGGAIAAAVAPSGGLFGGLGAGLGVAASVGGGIAIGILMSIIGGLAMAEPGPRRPAQVTLRVGRDHLVLGLGIPL